MKHLIKIITLLIAVVMITTGQSTSIQPANNTSENQNTSELTTSFVAVSKTTTSKAKEAKPQDHTATESKKAATTSGEKVTQNSSNTFKESPTQTSEKTTTKTENTAKPQSAIKPEPERPYKEMEERIVALVNEEREIVGVAPLKIENAFYNETLLRAKESIECWSHTRPNGKDCYTVYKNPYQYNIKLIGENLGKSFKTPEQIMEALMNSESHRENILNKNFTHVCVAITQMPPKKENQNYTLYAVTQHFYKMEESI